MPRTAPGMEALIYAALSPLKMLGGSVMIKVLVTVAAFALAYAISKLIAYYMSMRRTFRGVPCHPNTHWLWGHAHLVCRSYLAVHQHRGVLGVLPRARPRVLHDAR